MVSSNPITVSGRLFWLVFLFLIPSLRAGDIPEVKPVWSLKTKNKLENFTEVLGGKAFFTREDDYVTVINADGKIRWEKKLEGYKSKYFSAVYDDQFMYGTKKGIVILSMEDGSEKGLITDVEVSEGFETLRTKYGLLQIFEKTTVFYDLQGKKLWKRDDQNMSAKNYMVFENGNFIAFYSKSVHMIDYKTGQSLWNRNDQGFTPDLYHQLKSGNFIAFYSKGFALIDFNSGNSLYSTNEETDGDLRYTWGWSEAETSPVVVFLKKRTVLISGKDGKELWSAAMRGSEERGGVKKTGDCIDFVGNTAVIYMEKQIAGVNALTGQLQWQETVKDEDEIAEADYYEITNDQKQLVSGLISINGALLTFDPASGKKLWRTADGAFVGQVCCVIRLDGDDHIVVSGKRAFLMTNKDLGVHMYRVNMSTGNIVWHNQSRAIWSSVIGNSAKTTIEGVAAGPYFSKEAGLVVMVTNMGLCVYQLNDGKLLKEGKWVAGKMGEMKGDFTFENNKLMYPYSIVPPVNATGIISAYSGAFSAMRNTTFTNLNPDPVISNGVMYLTGDEKVFAIDMNSGKKLWDCDVNGPVAKLPFSQGMVVKDNMIYCRTGFYLDENILYGSQSPKPVVYGDKGDFGFVAVDAKSGKIAWKYQDFEGMDPVYLVDVMTDKAMVEKAQNGNCRLNKLKLGTVNVTYERPGYTLLGGGNGLAGIQRDASDPCKSIWKIEDSFDKASSAYELGAGTNAVMLFFKDVHKALICSNKNFYLIDEATHQVVWKAKKESDAVQPVLVSPKNGLAFDVDGKEIFAYKLLN
ncbi:PQQ-binding-like beta-propeller repeat protein [bacterium]|nr:PQQ-binding-like beta-propeller repeat protein [bacterium]